MRQFFVGLHRWIRLATAGILVVVALTGSLMAFIQEVDRFLNPDFYDVATRDAPLLDALQLREKAEQSDPRYLVDIAMLEITRNAPVGFGVGARSDPATGQPFELPVSELYLDPYTGETVGARSNLAVAVDRSNFVLFIHDIHTNLALPEPLRGPAGTLIGLTALAWTLDCFIGFALTLPSRRRDGDARARRSWLSRWAPSWLIRGRSGAFRLNFDIHRAFGLWTWAMLFVLAWSGVALSLPEVYRPVMNALLGAPPAESPQTPPSVTPLGPDEAPKIGWREAYATGHARLGERARRGEATVHDKLLMLVRDQRRYRMCAGAAAMDHAAPDVCVEIDADTGAASERQEAAPPKKARVTIVTEWLTQIHMAMLYRPAMQYVVCLMGFVITALSITGVAIWWRKRAARRQRASRARLAQAAEAQP